MVRAKRICTLEESFLSEARMTINKLWERKYPEYILERAVKIQLISRYQLMETRPPNEDTRIRFFIDIQSI